MEKIIKRRKPQRTTGSLSICGIAHAAEKKPKIKIANTGDRMRSSTGVVASKKVIDINRKSIKEIINIRQDAVVATSILRQFINPLRLSKTASRIMKGIVNNPKINSLIPAGSEIGAKKEFNTE